ncbi:MAG: hypothetical protein FWG25_06285, partial [Promicromonosporaceae bacterium]|nr:hypothetical protein [Promicromonosporaceae bacterium]
MMRWRWQALDPAYGSYGNPNQWTVNAGIASLARESMQNSADARLKTSSAGSSSSAQSAEVVFSLIRLTGETRKEFENALDWQALREHLGAMAGSATGSTAAEQLKAGLDAVTGSTNLILLRIADYGCTGLTGPELVTDTNEAGYGNFIKLCRLDLFSGKDEAAGGSFGLGKAVYWRFSRLQTVLFNSTVVPGTGVGGEFQTRLFGVQQGVTHRTPGAAFNGRGFFGAETSTHPGIGISTWGDQRLAERLQLARRDARPGTSALLIGFYDPDDDERFTGIVGDLKEMAERLSASIAESFWPLLTRNRMRVSIEVLDNEELVSSQVVDPGEAYPELVTALRKYDAGEVEATLDAPGSVTVRDVTIDIPKRKLAPKHNAFDHQAKLVVTRSDAQPDSLENRTCLLRQSEMVVETIDRTYEGQQYHAFLLAGGAVSKDAPTPEDLLADDFLRFAEPPAHDQWIPGVGRRATAQVNLGTHYFQPYKQNLTAIKTRVEAELTALFGPPPVATEKPPESVMKHLAFLKARPGSGAGSGSAGRRPGIVIDRAELVGGHWDLTFTVSAQNRPQGWSVVPALEVAGLDNRGVHLPWAGPLEAVGGSELVGGRVNLRPQVGKRVLKGKFRAT